MKPTLAPADLPLDVNSTEPVRGKAFARPWIGLVALWFCGFVCHLLLGARAEPALTIDVRAEKNELVRVLFDFGVGFADRAAADTSIRAGSHRLCIALPADSRMLKQLEIAPVLAGGPAVVERIALGFPGRERVWDRTTGFDSWRLPEASPEKFAPGKPMTCVAYDRTKLLLLRDVAAVVDLSPHLYKRQIAWIVLGWLLAGLASWLVVDIISASQVRLWGNQIASSPYWGRSVVRCSCWSIHPCKLLMNPATCFVHGCSRMDSGCQTVSMGLLADASLTLFSS